MSDDLTEAMARIICRTGKHETGHIAAYDKVQGGCRYSGYCTVTVDCEGDIVGANSYAQHYFDNKVPMARVDGLDDLQLVMRSI